MTTTPGPNGPGLEVPPLARNDLRDRLLALAEEHGCRVVATEKGHFRVYCPDGVTIVTVAGTTSDWRSVRNAAANIRKGGAPGVRL
jgi:hypothetical protein